MLIEVTLDKISDWIAETDLCNRIMIGQYDEMAFYYDIHRHFKEDKREFLKKEGRKQFTDIRDLLIPPLKGNEIYYGASLGIWSLDTPLLAKRFFDIEQCLRYQKTYYKYSKDKEYFKDLLLTVSASAPWIHGEWEMTSEQVTAYEQCLMEQRIYPDYMREYIVRKKWSCPIVIRKFKENREETAKTAKKYLEETTVTVEVECNSEVEKLLKISEQVADAVKEWDILRALTLLYPEQKENLKKFF